MTLSATTSSMAKESGDVMEDLILYHGSRGGIVGDIAPKSRARCDFGAGFYLGTHEEQAKSLIAYDSDPVFYTVCFHLSRIAPSKILTLKDMEWAYFVLYNRGKLESIKETALYQKYANLGKGKDVIVGAIADDNMNYVMRQFTDNQITDLAMLESIRVIDYGMQYVAKTEVACQTIEILSHRSLELSEAISLGQAAEERREECRTMVDQILLTYRRKGNYLDEILEKAQQQEPQRGLGVSFP